ncbi:MAG: hypothetical protein ACKVQR_02145 [Aquabacterium sp.]
MRPTPNPRPWRTWRPLALILAAGLLVDAPALAVGLNQMETHAEKNTVGSDTDTAPVGGDIVLSEYHGAYASARLDAGRRSVYVESIGDGNHVTQQYRSTAALRAGYTLWNTLENRALTFNEASGLTLAFDLRLRGDLSVPTSSDVAVVNMGTMGFTASVTGGSGTAQLAGDYTAVWHAPSQYTLSQHLVPSGTQSVVVGGSWLTGPVSSAELTFSLAHSGGATGLLFMHVQSSAAKEAHSVFDLDLMDVHLAQGSYAGLAVRFDSGGMVMGVSTIPEPLPSALLLSGLAVVAGVARRRGGYQSNNPA